MSAPTSDVPLEDRLAQLGRSDLAELPHHDVVGAIEEMVTHDDYPCLGARSVFRRHNAVVTILDDLSDPGNASVLLDRLAEFAAGVEPEAGFASFVAVFRGPQLEGERHFEHLLWQLLQRLHDADPMPWADGVAADPEDPHFAFSAGGTPYFVVGMHPRASRIARRAPLPTLVFNLHEQFEALRASGRFERMRDTIRRRDEELQGTVNPMVGDHGGLTEARQYAGRRVGARWRSPLVVHEDRAVEGPVPVDGEPA